MFKRCSTTERSTLSAIVDAVVILQVARVLGFAARSEVAGRPHHGHLQVITYSYADPHSLDELVARAPDKVLALRLDVTKPPEIHSAVASAMERFGAIDVLVNNAATASLARWRKRAKASFALSSNPCSSALSP